jgi:hypothetical protein
VAVRPPYLGISSILPLAAITESLVHSPDAGDPARPVGNSPGKNGKQYEVDLSIIATDIVGEALDPRRLVRGRRYIRR